MHLKKCNFPYGTISPYGKIASIHVGEGGARTFDHTAHILKALLHISILKTALFINNFQEKHFQQVGVESSLCDRIMPHIQSLLTLCS